MNRIIFATIFLNTCLQEASQTWYVLPRQERMIRTDRLPNLMPLLALCAVLLNEGPWGIRF